MSRQRLLTLTTDWLSVMHACVRRGFLGNVSRSGVRHLDIFCADLLTNATAPLVMGKLMGPAGLRGLGPDGLSPAAPSAGFVTISRGTYYNGMFYATAGTARFMQANDIPVEKLHWPLDDDEPNAATYIREGKIDLVINIPKNFRAEELANDYIIRRAAVDFNVPLITNRQVAQRFAEAFVELTLDDLAITPWRGYARPSTEQ